jgi:hypothetical protein
MIIRPGGAVFAPNAVTFPAAAPNAGVYNVVVNNTGGTAWTLSFFNSSPSYTAMTTPQLRAQRLGAVAPVVNWNGQPLP